MSDLEDERHEIGVRDFVLRLYVIKGDISNLEGHIPLQRQTPQWREWKGLVNQMEKEINNVINKADIEL